MDWRQRRLWVLFLIACLLTACGGDKEGEEAFLGFVSGPDVGSGWASIDEPVGAPPNGRVETDADSLSMEGHAFVPPTASCDTLDGSMGTNYGVTWSNTANDSSGFAFVRLNCLFIVYIHWATPRLAIPLEVGDNPITITAHDGLGNVGRASILVVRRPPP